MRLTAKQLARRVESVFIAMALASWATACGRTGLRGPTSTPDGAADESKATDPAPRDDWDDQEVCTIASVRYFRGSANPSNACQSCQPDRSQSAWSDLAPGPGCLSSASTHTCALVRDSVWCWGEGILGDSTRDTNFTAVLVQGLASGVQAVATSSGRSSAVANGSVYFCGDFFAGNSAMSGSTTAVPVRGLDQGFVAATSSAYYSCALRKGEVWCWGSKEFGVFGSAVAGGTAGMPSIGGSAGIGASTTGGTTSVGGSSGLGGTSAGGSSSASASSPFNFKFQHSGSTNPTLEGFSLLYRTSHSFSDAIYEDEGSDEFLGGENPGVEKLAPKSGG